MLDEFLKFYFSGKVRMNGSKTYLALVREVYDHLSNPKVFSNYGIAPQPLI